MILSELTNWQENRTAVLEQSNDCVYLYSHPHQEDQDLRTLWVVNTKEKDTSDNSIVSDMKNGEQPYMPLKYCSTSGLITDFHNENDWRLQWGLDQNSIAVYFRNALFAVMPEWSGFKGFCGYSIGANTETEIAWPLLPDNEQVSRFARETEFLDSWNDDTWPQFQSNILSVYNHFMSENDRYFSADGGKWPPLGLSYRCFDDRHFWATVGMSILPMPVFGMGYDDPEKYRRVELAILVDSKSDTMPLGSYLSAQEKYPWYHGTHFDHGHTIPCQQLGEVGSNMSYMLIVEKASCLPSIDTSILKERDSRLLFMLPIYESEREFAEKHGSTELLEKFKKLGTDLLNVDRAAIM